MSDSNVTRPRGGLMRRGPGAGGVSAAATRFGLQQGITVIPGGCPLMFQPSSDGGHGSMTFILTLTGAVPKEV